MPTVASTQAAPERVSVAFGTEPNRGKTNKVPDLWRQREWLAWTWQYAKHYNLNPEAMLLQVLMREALRFPPNLLIPYLGVGTSRHGSSVNVYCAFVGASGDGKDMTDDSGEALIPNDTGYAVHQPVSGEGLNAMFVEREADLDPETGKRTGTYHQKCANPRVLLSVTESSQLYGASRIQSSTLVPALLSMFMGKPYSGFNKNAANRLELPAHSYRLCMSVGAQYDAAQVFLDNEGKGFPQRFLWSDVKDPDCDTDFDYRTTAPDGEFKWHVRYKQPSDESFQALYAAGDLDAYLSGLEQSRRHDADTYETTLLEYPQIAYRDAFNDSVNRNHASRSPLDGHKLLLTARVAAVVAAMRAPDLKVSDDDWDIAKRIVAISTRNREKYMERARRAMTDRMADDLEIRNEARASADEKVLAKAKTRILLVLDRDDPKREGIPEREIRNKVNTAQRRMFVSAIESLKDEGRIDWRKGPDDGAVYSLSV